MKAWLKGGLIAVILVFITYLIIPAGLRNIIGFGIGLIFWLIIGIGMGLMFQKKIGKTLKFLIILIILLPIPLWVTLKGGGELRCTTPGGEDRCPFSEWVGGLVMPFLTHGMFILGPAFIISLILILLSAVKELKDKEKIEATEVAE